MCISAVNFRRSGIYDDPEMNFWEHPIESGNHSQVLAQIMIALLNNAKGTRLHIRRRTGVAT